MKINKEEIISNICYTDLVYERINKKLAIDYSHEVIEVLILNLLKKTSESNYLKIGKNYYVTNMEDNIRITINSNTFRVITVDRLK